MREFLEQNFNGWVADAGDLIHSRFINSTDKSHRSIKSWITAFVDAITDSEFYRSKPELQSHTRELYLRAIASRRFMPTSAALGNYNKELRALAGCIVLPLATESGELTHNEISHILQPLKFGIGVGLDFSRINPCGYTRPSHLARGVTSSLKILSQACLEIRPSESIKHAALMASLSAAHPDIFDFIFLKRDERISVVNISIAIDGEFISSLKEGKLIQAGWVLNGNFHPLRASELKVWSSKSDLSISSENQVYSKRAGIIVGKVINDIVYFDPNTILKSAALAAHQCGDPGLINLDSINKANPTFLPGIDRLGVGAINTVTPCGEQPLLSYEMCHLGSIALHKHINGFHFDLAAFEETVRIGVRALDDVITHNQSQFGSSDELVKANRKVGLGVMGLADTLSLLDIPYDSELALNLVDKIGIILKGASHNESAIMADEMGPYPNWDITERIYPGLRKRRHATLTTIAPTGFISSLAACNPAIEPFYSVRANRLANGIQLEIPRPLDTKLKRLNFTLDQWIAVSAAKIENFQFDGTLSCLVDNPTGDKATDSSLGKLKKIFRTSREISPDFHIEMVARWQKYIDNGISKTIILKNDETPETVERLFRKSIDLNLKGITVYRDGSLSTQALSDAWPCDSCGGIIGAFNSDQTVACKLAGEA